MSKLGKLLSSWNFKKIAIFYVVAALIVAIGCGAVVGIRYRERLSFAYQYTKLTDTLYEGKNMATKEAVDKTAEASNDVVDILVLDNGNQIQYSAKHSKFAEAGTFTLKQEKESKYLTSPQYTDSVFQYVKNEEFMVKSIFNQDFGEIRNDYEEEKFYQAQDNSKTVYMLSCIRSHDRDQKIYVISNPTSVPGGMMAVKVSAAMAMLFFCIYWVLVALWMYRDADKSRFSPIYWGVIGLFTNLIGLLVYKIYKRSMAVCTACGAAQNNSYLYCTNCGAQLGVRCPHCGSKVNVSDKFCHTCGKAVEEAIEKE